MPVRFRRRGMRRRRANWQWARGTFNDVATITAGGFYQEDLLASFKSTFGIGANLPDIVIWRVRFRISVRITFPATITNPEAYAVVVALFVDDLGQTLLSPVTRPFSEKYMYYRAFYYSEMINTGSVGFPAANGANQFITTNEIDSKAHRRLGNLEDSLLLHVGLAGGLQNLSGLSVSHSTLLKMGR